MDAPTGAEGASVPAPPMSINWYPGHMRKARRIIEESMSAHDLVIEVLDARMPRASANPVLTKLRGHRPCLKVLTKSDLADPATTAAWIRWFEARPRKSGDGAVAAIAITTEKRNEIRKRIPELCRELASHRAKAGREVRAMVLGIPNVGKSTLINALAARKVTQVANKPAVTRAQQRVEVDDGLALSDNPGILPARLDDQRAALRLALGGAIPDTVVDLEAVSRFGAQLLLERYPALVVARYKLEQLPADADALLDEIGRRRGGLRPGGVVDRDKAAHILVQDFRSGALGRISLERPPSSG